METATPIREGCISMMLSIARIADTSDDVETLEVPPHVQESASGLVGPREPATTRLSARGVRHVISLLDTALGQLRHPDAAYSALLAATTLLRQHAMPYQGQPNAVRQVGLLAWQIRRIREYIDANISSRITVAQLSAQVHRSEGHFSRAFRQAVGESPHAYIINCRVQAAAVVMLESEATLSEIAIDCGFTDQAHLCRHFRNLLGQTPAAWRRAQRVDGGDATPSRGLHRLQKTTGVSPGHRLSARTAVEFQKDVLGV
jgi:AraC family transcriptional regulator